MVVRCCGFASAGACVLLRLLPLVAARGAPSEEELLVSAWEILVGGNRRVCGSAEPDILPNANDPGGRLVPFLRGNKLLDVAAPS